MTAPPGPAHDQARPVRVVAGALAGVLAAAIAGGAAQFASGLGVPQSSPVLAVGQAAIDLTPARVKDFAIATFGANDKTALLTGILIILALYAAAVGMLAIRRLAFGLGGLAVFAAIGLAAALTRPDATPGYVIPTLAGAVAGAVVLRWLTRAALRLGAPPDSLFPSDLHPELPGDPPPAPSGPASRPGLVRPSRPPDPGYPPGPTVRAGPAYAFSGPAHPDDQRPSRWPARRWFLFSAGAAAGGAPVGAPAGRSPAHGDANR